MTSKMYRVVFLAFITTVISCGGNSENTGSADSNPDSAATTVQAKTPGEWISLFDG